MTFHLILDENVDHEVATRLRAAGHDVVHVEDILALGNAPMIVPWRRIRDPTIGLS